MTGVIAVASMSSLSTRITSFTATGSEPAVHFTGTLVAAAVRLPGPVFSVTAGLYADVVTVVVQFPAAQLVLLEEPMQRPP